MEKKSADKTGRSKRGPQRINARRGGGGGQSPIVNLASSPLETEEGGAYLRRGAARAARRFGASQCRGDPGTGRAARYPKKKNAATLTRAEIAAQFLRLKCQFDAGPKKFVGPGALRTPPQPPRSYVLAATELIQFGGRFSEKPAGAIQNSVSQNVPPNYAYAGEGGRGPSVGEGGFGNFKVNNLAGGLAK